jgi:dienelactone hydrolase
MARAAPAPAPRPPPPPGPSRSGALVDYALLLAALWFAVHLSGPASVVMVATFVFHLLQGQPRAAFTGVYLSIALAVHAFRLDGLTHAKAALGEMTIVALRVALVSVVLLTLLLDRFLFPYGGRLPRPVTGGRGVDVGVLLVSSATADFMLRIFYPTKAAHAAEPLPYFLFGTATIDGISHFLRRPGFLLRWLVHTRPWCYEADPTTTPPGGPAAASAGGDGPPPRFPVIVFSHGLGGTPDVYGAVISELVSQGYVVAAVEHCDGSAAFTRMDDGFSRAYEPLTSAERASREREYRRRHGQLGERVREMCAAAELMCDIAKRPPSYAPSHKTGKAAGGGKKGAGGSSAAADAPAQQEEEEEEPLDLQLARLMLYGRLNTNVLVAMGHSFGGATALCAAEAEPRFTSAVLLDPWMFPVSAVGLYRGVARVPVLSITGEGWRVWKENEVALRIMLDPSARLPLVARSKAAASSGSGAAATAAGADDEGEASLDIVGSNGVAKDGSLSDMLCVKSSAVHPATACITLRGIEHHSFNDFSILAERLLRLTGGLGRRSAVEGVRLVARVAGAYLAHVNALQAAERRDPAAAQRAGSAPWKFSLPLELAHEAM